MQQRRILILRLLNGREPCGIYQKVVFRDVDIILIFKIIFWNSDSILHTII